MKQYHTVNIDGRNESLPLILLPSGVKIAFLNLHGNPALTEYCGIKIAGKLKGCAPDILITAESKGLQLTHVAARELGHEAYAVARKAFKIYMGEHIEADASAITNESAQKLYLSQDDCKKLSGKRVVIVDDVISTGGSVKALAALVQKAGGMVVACACVLAEGDSAQNNNILRLADIPLF